MSAVQNEPIHCVSAAAVCDRHREHISEKVAAAQPRSQQDVHVGVSKSCPSCTCYERRCVLLTLLLPAPGIEGASAQEQQRRSWEASERCTLAAEIAEEAAQRERIQACPRVPLTLGDLSVALGNASALVNI